MSFPSCSAISIIRFAILSFTEPPAEVYSSFPTDASSGLRDEPWKRATYRLTEITPKALKLRYPIEANEGSVSNGVKDRI